MQERTPYFLCLIFFIALSCGSTKEVQKVEKSIMSLKIQDEISIFEIQKAYSSKEYSVQDLTQFYLDRIELYNPILNAVITVNPDAIKIAEELQKELDSGKSRGPLHGIPILLKDNIDTADKMPCTVGANAMKESFPLIDSAVAAQLRRAGAILLGKANLSEWANFHSLKSSSGWSAIGGQTNNPYDVTRNPCGSSAGSGVAVSANLCVVAIGTETNGSIVCPSNNNGVVGIKPTVGLISRSGIVPISWTQDTSGPMARSVEDAAICLGSLIFSDPNDKSTQAEGRVFHKDYSTFLNIKGLEGKRIGVYRVPLGERVKETEIFEEAISYMASAGAEIIELEELIADDTGSHSFQVLLYEFKDGLNKYFKTLGPNSPVKNLDDLIKKTFADEEEMRYHDHMLLKKANKKGDLSEKEYLDAKTKMLRQSREEGIDKVMNENNLDAIVMPTGGPAWKTDIVVKDNFGGIFSSSPAAISGYPSITVPMGNIEGLPIGISIIGQAWTESKLIEIAYSYEQGTKKRITPNYKNAPKIK